MNVELEALAVEAVARGAQQNPQELVAFGGLVLERRLGSAIELGTCWGGTAWFLARLGLEVVAVDANVSQVRDLNRDPAIRYVQAWTLEFAVSAPTVDLVFVDATHTYEDAKADWEAYRGKVTPGGLVAFHDIVNPPSGWAMYVCDVARLWRELKLSWGTWEVVCDPLGWGGIGAVLL